MDDTFKGVSLQSQFDAKQYRVKLEAMSDTELRKEGRMLVESVGRRKVLTCNLIRNELQERSLRNLRPRRAKMIGLDESPT